MSYIHLSHSNMKPAPLVRFEIEQEHSRTKTLLVGSVIAAAMIMVLASMFLTAIT